MPRWLARCNWRPVFEIEQQTERLRIETEQLRIETELIRTDNARLAELESKLDALLRSADSCSPPPPAAGGN